MIKINLLPIKEIKLKLRRRREVYLLASSLLLLLVLLIGVTLALGAKMARMEAEVKTLDQRRASYAAIQKEINEIKQKKEQLEARINAVNQLRADSQLTVRLLDEIGNLTPSARMWLNSLRITANRMTLAGIGLDNPTIAQYMQALEGSAYFASADLASSSQADIGGQKLKSFSLTSRISPPPSPATNAEGAQ